MFPELWFFLKGALVGLSIAAPVGPVAILCIRQSLSYGWLVGIAAGLGTAIADGCFGAIAAFGTQLVQKLIDSHGHWFYLIGGSFLLYIGAKIFQSEIHPDKKTEKGKRTYAGAFMSTLFLTFASPMTTILFVGMFTTMGVFEKPLAGDNILPLSLGVSFGAFAWWICLTGIVSFVSKKMDFKVFTTLNKISGVAIFLFGLLTISKIFH